MRWFRGMRVERGLQVCGLAARHHDSRSRRAACGNPCVSDACCDRCAAKVSGHKCVRRNWVWQSECMTVVSAKSKTTDSLLDRKLGLANFAGRRGVPLPAAPSRTLPRRAPPRPPQRPPPPFQLFYLPKGIPIGVAQKLKHFRTWSKLNQTWHDARDTSAAECRAAPSWSSDVVQTYTMPTRQSIHCVPEMAHALSLRETKSMSQEWSQTDIALKIGRDPSQDV